MTIPMDILDLDQSGELLTPSIKHLSRRNMFQRFWKTICG